MEEQPQTNNPQKTHIYKNLFNTFQETSINIGGLTRDCHTISRQFQIGDLMAYREFCIILRELNLYTKLMIPDKIEHALQEHKEYCYKIKDKIEEALINKINIRQTITKQDIQKLLNWHEITFIALKISGLQMPIEKIRDIDPLKILIPS
jgi:hypothetical protein